MQQSVKARFKTVLHRTYRKHSEHYLICSLIKNSNRCLRLDSDDMQ